MEKLLGEPYWDDFEQDLTRLTSRYDIIQIFYWTSHSFDRQEAMKDCVSFLIFNLLNSVTRQRNAERFDSETYPDQESFMIDELAPSVDLTNLRFQIISEIKHKEKLNFNKDLESISDVRFLMNYLIKLYE